jgi:hypothetical protein
MKTRTLALAIIIFSSLILLAEPAMGIDVGFSYGDGSSSSSTSSKYVLDSSTILNENVVAGDGSIYKESTLFGSGTNKLETSISSKDKTVNSKIQSTGNIINKFSAGSSQREVGIDQNTKMSGSFGSITYNTNSINNNLDISSSFDGEGGNLDSSVISVASDNAEISGNIDSLGISLLDSESMSVLGSGNLEMALEGIYASPDGQLGKVTSSASNILTPIFVAGNGDPSDYALSGRRWNTKDPQLKFILRDDTYLRNEKLTAINVQTAIIDASNAWDDATNQNLFADSNLVTISPTVSIDSYNKLNTIGWKPFLNNCLAYSRTWYKSTLVDGYKTIVDSDIVFNTKYAWRTEGTVGADVQTIALHEIGHSLGLGDLYNSEESAQTMYGYYLRTDRTLGNGDTAGIYKLYG